MGAARRGRPAKVAAPEPAIPVAVTVPPNPPKKRGRPPKTNTVETVTVEPPKRRGRQPNPKNDKPIAQIDSAIRRGRRSLAAAEEAIAEAHVSPKRRPGRPSKATSTAAAAEAIAPKKRGGRPRKEDVVPEALITPKRGRRPTLDLNRVAGPSRVTKRTSPRSKPVARASKVVAAPRINPKMRSRLRQRTAPIEKVKKEALQPVKKARGRPKKVQVEVGRKPSAPVPAAPVKKVTARPKTVAPRKRRGYTTLEVPDKFAAQVKQLVADLQAENAANAAAAAGEADDEGEEIEVEVELGTNDPTADPLDNPSAELEQEEAAAELVEEDEDKGEDDEDRMPIDPLEAARVPATDEGIRAESSSDNIGDETELPSETAVFAEIAAVQDDLDAQDALRDDVQMAENVQPEVERESSPSNVSVDVHQEITEVSSFPQADGTNEVEVFHAHIDEHAHIHEHAHATEPAAGSVVGSLFSGF
ncbi:DNA binding [Ascochyta rabiei]|uniref:DNA binding n=2 Tax=Didymella rabiei TaxID=5454 RepID=A0A163K363_DIDRA|nr:DNA binding [Ascochyta rabiei]